MEELSEGFDEKWITLVAPPPTQDGLDKYTTIAITITTITILHLHL